MLKAALLLTSILYVSAASAATVTFTNSYSNLTDTSPNIADSFNLSSFISNTIPTGSQLDIYSATIGFTGYSSANNTYSSVATGTYYDHTRVETYTSTYQCGFSYCTDTYYSTTPIFGTTYAVTNGDHEVDRVRVSFGLNTLVDDTYQPASSSSGSGYLTRYSRFTGNSYGNVSDSDALNSSGLASLNGNNILNYNVDVTSGQFYDLSVSLQIDYNIVSAPSPVPLPASVLLMGAALGGLSLTRRRKKTASS